MRPVDMVLAQVWLLGCLLSAVGCAQSTGPLPPGTHAGWYVTTAGTSSGAGTTDSPWGLQTALSGGNGKVQPGDTIWLRRGTYRGTYVAGLSGTAAAPIIVRQYPGERATIDGGTSSVETLTVDGQFAVYSGFEIMQSGTARFGTAGTGTGLRPTGVYVRNASNVKLINLIVHDVGHGAYTENTAHNIEIYGWIIYNGGYEDANRSDGHGIYIKNDGNGWKIARDNVIFNQYGFGIHGYTESSNGQTLKNLVLDGNVLFNNGSISSFTDNPNLQLGGNGLADNDTVENNMLYFSPGFGEMNARVGYQGLLNGTARVTSNYIVGAGLTLDVGYWTSLAVAGNTLTGSTTMVVQHDASSPATQVWTGNRFNRDPSATAWQLAGVNYAFSAWQATMSAGDQATIGTPSATQVFVRRNLYEPGRATVVVYNWGSMSSVSVTASSVLTSGDHYQVRNVQDIFGSPVVSGTYGGGTISIPMSGVNPPAPIGGSARAPRKTGPVFDVFVLTRS